MIGGWSYSLKRLKLEPQASASGSQRQHGTHTALANGRTAGANVRQRRACIGSSGASISLGCGAACHYSLFTVAPVRITRFSIARRSSVANWRRPLSEAMPHRNDMAFNGRAIL